MANPIEGAGQVQGGQIPSLSSGASATVQGNFRGENVVHSKDPVAALEDAAEELTFVHSEKVEKKLAKRRINRRQALKSFAAEQAEKYLKAIPDLEKSGKIDDFSREILKKGKRNTPESLRESARQFSDDETLQFVALSHTYERAKEENADSELIDALETSITALQDEAGPAIQAGLNVSAVADGFSDKDIGDVQQLRDFYRDVVLDYSSANDAYRRIAEQCPGTSLPEAINFLLKSLAADLEASNHSLEKPQLMQIMNDMYQLKLLNGMHDQCQDLLIRVRSNYDGVAESIGTTQLMEELLAAKDKGWQGGAFFSALPDRLGIRGNDAQIYFLQGFKDVLRMVPLKAFEDDPVKRQRLLQTIQQALDTAIDNELADA